MPARRGLEKPIGSGRLANNKVLSSIPARNGGAAFDSTLWARLLSHVALQDREESALSVCNNATASIPLNVGCSTFFKT